MKKHIFIGVDGGATKSIIRVETASGELVGRTLSGPASLRNSVSESWQSIHNGLNKIFNEQQILAEDYILHAGFGLAGCEIKEAYQSFLATSHPFATLSLTSDAHIACLAAHSGQDGAIIIIGTGAVGYFLQGQRQQQVAGWGFPHDDIGAGAWLGMQAVGIALRHYDKRLKNSRLAVNVQQYFANDLAQLVNWANHASPRLFATLAPLVMASAKEGDPHAIALLKQAASAIEDVYGAFQSFDASAVPCALVGSIAPFLVPYLKDPLKSNLRPAQLSPDQGAVIMVKQAVLTEVNIEG